MGNSIIDGLKSRLMQYLAITLTTSWFVSEKHVVEDDVLFTKVISKFEPITLHWKQTYFDIYKRVTSQIEFCTMNSDS